MADLRVFVNSSPSNCKVFRRIKRRLAERSVALGPDDKVFSRIFTLCKFRRP